jgi:hypothetical protein
MILFSLRTRGYFSELSERNGNRLCPLQPISGSCIGTLGKQLRIVVCYVTLLSHSITSPIIITTGCGLVVRHLVVAMVKLRTVVPPPQDRVVLPLVIHLYRWDRTSAARSSTSAFFTTGMR